MIRRPSNLLRFLLAPMLAAIAFVDDPAAGGAADPAAGGAADPGAGGFKSLMADAPAGGAADPAAGGDPAAKATDPAAKTADPAAKTADPAAKTAAPAVPEKYEFKAPEGFVVDEALAAEFTPVLKDLGLTQEQADKLVAFGPKIVAPAVDAAVSKTLDSLGYAGCKDWVATAKVDPEIGGEKFAENLAMVKAARDQFASPALRKLLETSPLGNNPEMLRLFYRIGKQITPDGYLPGGKTTTPAPFFDKSPQLK